MKLLLGCLMAIMVSCASDNFEKKTSLENVYLSNGIEKYFLTPLAQWANFSTYGQCFRKVPVKYLNFENLKKNYNLTYEQMISLQHTFNKKVQTFDTKMTDIPLKDEAFVFYNSYEQVVGGSREFVLPKFDKISLIWIDPYLNDQPEKIKELFKNESLMQGHPVLISSCLSSLQMDEFAEKHKLTQYGVKHIPAEMFSPFDEVSKARPSFGINLPLVLKNKEIIVFGKDLPDEFIGIKKKR